MKCAIVALGENEEKRNGFGLAQKKASICEVDNVYSTDSVTVYTFGADKGRVCEWREKKLQKAVDKCIKELKSRGVKSLYLTDEVREFVGEEYFKPHFRVPDGQAVFDALLCDAMRWGAENMKLEADEAKIGIWQSEFDEHGYDVLERVCDEFKYVSIYSADVLTARIYASRLYENTGAAVNMSDNAAAMSVCDIVVLIDAPQTAIVNEKTFIIDMEGKYPYRCKNAAAFKLAFGYNLLMKYFGISEQRCVEFLLDAGDISVVYGKSLVQYLNNIGCSFEKLLYISHKNC